jgi:MFS family permease
LLWGAVMGIQESTMRAAVADLVPTRYRGTAYGVFAAGFGIATFIGGALTGILYGISIPGLLVAVAVIEICAIAILVVALRKQPKTTL